MICEGIKFINLADWPHLKYLFLCMGLNTELAINLLKRRSLTYVLEFISLFSRFGVILRMYPTEIRK